MLEHDPIQENNKIPSWLQPKEELTDGDKLWLWQAVIGLGTDTEFRAPIYDPKIHKFLNKKFSSEGIINVYGKYFTDEIITEIAQKQEIKLIDLLDIVFKNIRNLNFINTLIELGSADNVIVGDNTEIKLLKAIRDYHISLSYFRHRLAVMMESKAGAYSWVPYLTYFVGGGAVSAPFGDYFFAEDNVYGYLYTTILGAVCTTLAKAVSDYGNSIAARKKHMRKQYNNFNTLLELCYLNGLIVKKDNTFQLEPELKSILNIVLKTWHKTFERAKIDNFSQLNDFQVIDCMLNQLHALVHFFILQKHEGYESNKNLKFKKIFTDNAIAAIISSHSKMISKYLKSDNCFINFINCHCAGFVKFKRIPDIAEFKELIKRHIHPQFEKGARNAYTILSGKTTFWDIYELDTNNKLIPSDKLSNLMLPIRNIISRRPGARSIYKMHYLLVALTSFIAGIPIFNSFEGFKVLTNWMRNLIALAAFPVAWCLTKLYLSIMKSYHFYHNEYNQFFENITKLINVVYIPHTKGTSEVIPIFRKYMYAIANAIDKACISNKIEFSSLPEQIQALIVMRMLNTIMKALKLQHDKALDIDLNYYDVDCLTENFAYYLDKAIAEYQKSTFSHEAITKKFTEEGLSKEFIISVGDKFPQLYHKTLLQKPYSHSKKHSYTEPPSEFSHSDPAQILEKLLLATRTYQSKLDPTRKRSSTVLPEAALYTTSTNMPVHYSDSVIPQLNTGQSHVEQVVSSSSTSSNLEAITIQT